MNCPVVIVDSGASQPKVNPPEKEKIVTKFEFQLLSIVLGGIILAMVLVTLGYNLAFYLSCRA
jgi:hypothetical protein